MNRNLFVVLVMVFVVLLVMVVGCTPSSKAKQELNKRGELYFHRDTVTYLPDAEMSKEDYNLLRVYAGKYPVVIK